MSSGCAPIAMATLFGIGLADTSTTHQTALSGYINAWRTGSTLVGRHRDGGATRTGRPVAADRSAAKMTSCVLAASLRLVKGNSRPASSAWKKALNWFSYGWSVTSPESHNLSESSLHRDLSSP